MIGSKVMGLQSSIMTCHCKPVFALIIFFQNLITVNAYFPTQVLKSEFKNKWNVQEKNLKYFEKNYKILKTSFFLVLIN